MKSTPQKIVIANTYRCKGKQSFFAMHQIYSKIKNYRPDVEVQFHILWDNNLEGQSPDRIEWEAKIDSFGFDLVSYDKEFFIDYVSSAYDIPRAEIETRLKKFFPLYHIIMPHYFRRVLMMDYYIIYDDDILINYDFADVIDSALNHRPVLITEPYHANCDKVLFPVFQEMMGGAFVERYTQRNPENYGFNAGFQGIDLAMYDEFLSKSGFIDLLNLFDYTQVFDENGNVQLHGYDRTRIETQQQSFFGLLNLVMSRNEPYILDPKTNYVAPNFGYSTLHGEIDPNDGLNGWSVCLKSKISHFIGHTEGRGKPTVFLDKMGQYLVDRGLTNE